MNSAEDVEPPTAGGHDERLLRAFDRVARLGIDLEDGLDDREAAAVRAFAALHRDDDPGGFSLADSPSPPLGIPTVDPPPPPVDGPADTSAPATGRDDGEGPLRPDAVLRSRRFTPRDDEYAPGGHGSDGIEVEIPSPTSAPEPTPSSSPGPDTAAGTGAAGTAATIASDATAAPAAADAAAFDPPERSGDGYLLDVAALGVASGAFVWPWAWPAAVVVSLVVAAVACSVAAHGASPTGMLWRGLKHVLSWLRPQSLLMAIVLIARTAVLAVLLPALAAAGWWIITEGIDGALVAARFGVWTHGWRVAAATACFVLVAGGGEARSRRVVQVRRVTGRLGTTAVVVVAAVIVATALAVAVAAPRAGGGWSTRDDGLAWAPANLRDNLDRLRDDLVSAEVHAASGCLSDHQSVRWRATYTTGNPLGDDDVVRLSAARSDDAHAPSFGHLATAVAAIHNQVAPWVETIEIEVDGTTVVVLDRSDLPGGTPLVDPVHLVGAAGPGGDQLAQGAGGFDRAVALSCSAAPLP